MYYPDLSRTEQFAFDTETTGLDYPVDKAFGFSVATESDSWYYDIRKNPEALDWLDDQTKHYKGDIVTFNANFDWLMTGSAGLWLPENRFDDTAIRAVLIDETLGTVYPWSRGRPIGYSLDALSQHYIGAKKVDEIYEELAEIFGGKATRKIQMPNLHKAPSEIVAPYAKQDTILTLELWHWQNKEIERQEIEQVVEFEREALPTVMRNQRRGVRVDIEAAQEAQFGISVQIDKTQQKINAHAGEEVNVNSSKQVQALFGVVERNGDWVTDSGFILPKTPKGNASINADALRELGELGDDRANLITEVRSSIRTRDTFLGKHVIGSNRYGRVYPTINQVAGEEGGTRYGRFSYTKPALQQIPNRNKDVARIVKACFLPEEGHVWVDTDLNSFEVRVFAHLVSMYNKAILRMYEVNPVMDFHQWVAELMNVPRNPQPKGGANAKQLNLSMIFNSGNGSIAAQLKLPWEYASFTDKAGKLVEYKKAGVEAMKVIDAYHRRVQGVKTLATRCRTVAEDQGYIKTMFGRRLRFKNGYKAYAASGLLIQATSADINKQNWGIVEESLGGIGHMILNTHDSYSMSMPEDTVETGLKRVKENIEEEGRLRVPLILDLNGVGKTWAHALGIVK